MCSITVKTVLKNYKLCLIIIILNHTVALSSSNSTNICGPKIKVTPRGHFEWKIKHKNVPYAISEPELCWSNKSVVIHQCDFKTGLWISENKSCDLKPKRNSECADGLIEEFQNGKVFCLKISQKQDVFNESFCYGSDKMLDLSKKEVRDILLKRGLSSIWLPVKRFKLKRYNPFVIRLPGDHWNQVYSLSILDILKDKHCLAAYIDENETEEIRVQVTNCNSNLHSVCVYDRDPVVLNSCPLNFAALSYRPHVCYGVLEEEQASKYQMLNVEESNRYSRSLNLLFRKQSSKKSFLEVNGTVYLNRVKWGINLESGKFALFPKITSLKRLSVKIIPYKKNVEMLLRTDPKSEGIILTVYNKLNIWSLNSNIENSINCFCFTGYGEMFRIKINLIWENFSQTKTLFELKVNLNYRSQYWCEAHTIFDFDLVSTNTIVAAKRHRGHVFAMPFKKVLKDEYGVLTIEKLFKIEAKYIKNIFKVTQSRDLRLKELLIHNVKVISILSASINDSSIVYSVHTTASLKSSVVDNGYDTSSGEDSNDDNVRSMQHDTEICVRVKQLLFEMMQTLGKYTFDNVRSTEYCLPENNWKQAVIGQSETLTTLCLQNDGLPIYRKCMGNFEEGASWETIFNNTPNCNTNINQKHITKDLYDMDLEQPSITDTKKIVVNIRKLLESNVNFVIPADLYYLAHILRNRIQNIFKPSTMLITTTTATHDETTRPIETALEIVRIFNTILDVNKFVMHSSIVLNSTNVLLELFENLIDRISLETYNYDISSTTQFPGNLSTNYSYPNSTQIQMSQNEIDFINYADVGVVVQIAKNFVIFALDPSVANVTGVALFQTLDANDEYVEEGMLRGAFKNEYYRFILANQNASELLNEYNIVTGSFMPENLLRRLDEISNYLNKTSQSKRPGPRIIIKIYANDNLFQGDALDNNSILATKVISVSVPGYDRDLPEPLPLILSTFTFNDDVLSQPCSYWNYKSWVNDGVILMDTSQTNNKTFLCGCTHLTPFAYLIRGGLNLPTGPDKEITIAKSHHETLDLITFLGCSLSLIGVIGMFVTACIFRLWRKKQNSIILLQLSAAIGMQMILFCFVNTKEYTNHLIENEIFTSCIAIGAFLHYTVLVQFCWMAVIAYLLYKRYVQVFRTTHPTRFLVKSACVGWGIPVIPVCLVLIFDSTSYIPHKDDAKYSLCYPSGISLYTSVFFPITLVVMTNFIIFSIIIFNLIKGTTRHIRSFDKKQALSQIRLSVLLFFLLGFTWIFGLLANIQTGLIFSYLFCVTSTLQGFVIFIYFIIMDPVTRRMWCGKIRKVFKPNGGADTSTSMNDIT